jgi:hypothetical protein
MPLRLWSQALWDLGPRGTGVSLYKQYQKRACVRVCVHVCTCIYIHIYIYYVYIHTYTHTHTHTITCPGLQNWITEIQLGNSSCILTLSLLLTYSPV